MSSIRPDQRLSRTFSRARWREYATLLRTASRSGYEIVSLEDWVLNGSGDRPALILRHDVDQHPRSALRMAAIEQDAGVRSTWYFRWRTAHPAVIAELRARGFQVGLHYETLTRSLLKETAAGVPDNARIARCRAELREEIAAFAARHGEIRSACPHGDSRVPGVHNGVLLRGEDCATFGIEFDGNEAMRGRGLQHWLTDRSAAEGGWAEATDPLSLLARRVSPILCLTHPNNWTSGPDLWGDRILALLLPATTPRRPIRTGRDAPPLVRAAKAAVPPCTPVRTRPGRP